jgi:hypothetical protein
MAVVNLQSKALTGLSLTLQLYPLGSGVLANTGGDVCTETANGNFNATVGESLTGVHHATYVLTSTGAVLYEGLANMSEDPAYVDSTTQLIEDLDVDISITSFSSAALQQLQAAPIVITQPLGPGAAVSITRGMDYNEDDNRAIVWTDSAVEWPVLTAATITIYVWGKSAQGRPLKVFAGSVKTATGDTKQVQLELTDSQTSGMAAGDWVYGVKATLSSGSIIDLIKPVHQWKVVDFPQP